jgi:hypothetical protein
MRKRFDVAGIAHCMRAIRAHAIDLVHTHSSPDAWTCGIAARLAGVRVVRSRHLSTPVKPQWPSRFVYGRLADRVIASGQAIKDHLVQAAGLAPENIVSIRRVDERFAPRSDGQRCAANPGSHRFRGRHRRRLAQLKGHAHLIDAVHQLGAQNVPAKLPIAERPAGRRSEAKGKQLGMTIAS